MGRHVRPSPWLQRWRAMGAAILHRGGAQTVRPVRRRSRRALALAAAGATALVVAPLLVPALIRPTGQGHRVVVTGHRGTASHRPHLFAGAPAAWPTPPPPAQPAPARSASGTTEASGQRARSQARTASRPVGTTAAAGRAREGAHLRATQAASAPQVSGPSGSARPATGKGQQQGGAPPAAALSPTLLRALPELRPPVEGKVLGPFGWAYSAVFADWQEHTGVDLAAEPGEVVKAPASGTVVALRQDPLWGWVVGIALSHGYSTNLSGLATVGVKVGQAVHVGETIGTAGASPPAEGNLPPHVFWQVFAAQVPVDPLAG